MLTRKRCPKSLYKVCGRHALFPRAMQIVARYRTSHPLYKGGFADVWKGKWCDRDVAVKVIRMYKTSDLQKIVGVSC